MSRIKDAFDAVAEAIIAQKDYLSDIDAKAGDGDHGLNMARGFRAAKEALDDMEDTTQIGPVLKKIGKSPGHRRGGAASVTTVPIVASFCGVRKRPFPKCCRTGPCPGCWPLWRGVSFNAPLRAGGTICAIYKQNPRIPFKRNIRCIKLPPIDP